jgi:predicted Zn-dependent protease
MAKSAAKPMARPPKQPASRRLISRATLIVICLLAIGYGLFVAGSYALASRHFRAAQADLLHCRFRSAREHLNHCLHAWPDNMETCLLAAQAARRDGAFDEAQRLLANYRALGGVPEAIDLEMKLTRAQQGDVGDVEKYLWGCVETKHADAAAILEALAEGYVKSFRWPQALTSVNRLLETEPEHRVALLLKAMVHENLQDVNTALEYYNRLVGLDPTDDEARIRLAGLQATLAHPAEAAEQFENLRQRQPDNPAVLYGLARCRADLKEFDAAQELLKRLLEREPKNAAAMALQGKIALDSGDMPQAEKWLRQSLAVAPFEREPLYFLSQCLSRQPDKQAEAHEINDRLKEVEADQKELQNLLRESVNHPRDVDIRHKIGALLLKNGQVREGLGFLTGILQENPKHAATHQTLAEHFEKVGRHDLAIYHRSIGAPKN